MRRIEFVQKFQQKLASQFPIGFQNRWTKFIFHFSDVHNIVSILNSGKLYSRARAIELGLMQNDNANSNVIDNTVEAYKDYVRLYFGAKTPTQYMNEGIKSKHKIVNDAHCPVPVFLLFDFVKLLASENVRFSGGNLASSGVDIYTNIEDLERLEFNYIYHREPLPSERLRNHIQYCRHAEVLVLNEVNIDKFLKYVYVRSQAEKETLLYGLNDNTIERLKNKVIVFSRDGLFWAKELFVNSVTLKRNNIEVELSIAPLEIFEIVLYGKDLETEKSFETLIEGNISQHVFSWHLRNYNIAKKGFYFKIEIDGNIVYQNILKENSDDIF